MKPKTLFTSPVRIFLINTVGAVVPPLFTWALQSHFTLYQAWLEFRVSFIYAQIIGSLFQYSLPWMWRRSNALLPVIRWTVRIGLVVPFCIIGALAASAITAHFHLAGDEGFWTLFQQSIKLATVIGIGTTIVASLISELSCKLENTELRLRTEQLDRERALKQASEARLSSLESRIHPHFLFNTINAVSSLIRDEPVRAERLLERMAALLRFSLDAHQNGLVPLDREMKIVADYLEIEKTRFADRLTYSIEIRPGLGGLSIPPLSVQTIVENCVKYAVGPRREGGRISVVVQRGGEALQVDVWDDGPDFSLAAIPAGHGLDNLKARLTTLFGDAGTLDVIAEEEGKTVRLTVPVTLFARQTA